MRRVGTTQSSEGDRQQTRNKYIRTSQISYGGTRQDAVVGNEKSTFIRLVGDYFSKDGTIKLKFEDQKGFSHARRAEKAEQKQC